MNPKPFSFKALDGRIWTIKDGEWVVKTVHAAVTQVLKDHHETFKKLAEAEKAESAKTESADGGPAKSSSTFSMQLQAEITRAVTIFQETGGRWIADITHLPGVMAYGDTRDEALSAVQTLGGRVLTELLEFTLYTQVKEP